ncbi:MAG: metallophosphoesterase [Verrucomicrobiales bacterium]
MHIRPLSLFVAATLLVSNGFAGTIERIWLTHASNDPSKIVINWETETPGNSEVEFGTTTALGSLVSSDEKVTLHHVEIPLEARDTPYYYRVRSGDNVSEVASFKGYPTTELRIAIVGDWGGFFKKEDVAAIVKDNVHLIVTAGDNVSNLYQSGKEETKAYSALIDSNNDLFRSTPLMPILGNHDRQLTPRGPIPPAHQVYDIEATAYRQFFALPGDEWKWHFDLADFDLRFIALDLNHISDFGNTWQTCHAFQPDSEQFKWYTETMAHSTSGFVFTLMNEKHTQVKGHTKGAWHEHFRKGSALVTGFGYFADRAELDGGLPYYNTCFKGNGAPYIDSQSKFHSMEGNYLLLSLTAGSPTMKVEFKNLQGKVLDTTEISKRP